MGTKTILIIKQITNKIMEIITLINKLINDIVPLGVQVYKKNKMIVKFKVKGQNSPLIIRISNIYVIKIKSINNKNR